MSTKEKAKYYTLMVLCKVGSMILGIITLGIPQLIKVLNTKADEFEAKAKGNLSEDKMFVLDANYIITDKRKKGKR